MAIQADRESHDGSQDRGAHTGQLSDETRAHTAREHERSAERYDSHALLLDRHGAHRSANTERRHAEEERSDAEAARQITTRELVG